MSETLLGRYRLDNSLGRGSAAEVYRARDLELGRDVAVKVLRGEGLLADAARLREEARALARLAHPHILELLSIEEDDGQLFLVLELADGGSLASRLASHGPVSEAEARDLLGQVLEALSAAHGVGIVHRDVSPSNVLISRQGEILLTDFGVAKAMSGASRQQSAVKGKVPYMSPEQLSASAVTVSIWIGPRPSFISKSMR